MFGARAAPSASRPGWAAPTSLLHWHHSAPSSERANLPQLPDVATHRDHAERRIVDAAWRRSSAPGSAASPTPGPLSPQDLEQPRRGIVPGPGTSDSGSRTLVGQALRVAADPTFFQFVRHHRSVLRRLLSVLALSGFLLAGVFEPAFGLLRDGQVHHETAASASTHTSTAGEHGHEDGGTQPGHPHGPSHQHGTSSDHCTHGHSVGLPSAQPIASSVVTATPDQPCSWTATSAPPEADCPPPKS